MNHAAFYDRIKRMSEAMTKIQKKEDNIAVAEYLRDTRYSGEWINTVIEDEKDNTFFKDFLFTITYYSNPDDIVNNCFEKINSYLGNNTEKKEENNIVRTIHDRIVEEMQTLRESIDKYSNRGVEKNAKGLKDFAEVVLTTLSPDEESDREFVESLIQMIRYYDGDKLISNVKANLDDYLFTEEQKEKEESNTMNNNDPVIPIDELAKKIANKKNMDANNVGFTILSGMLDLVVQSTNKLVDNIEEEEYLNIVDKQVARRDLNILVHAYSNILEILGQYYVKLEK